MSSSGETRLRVWEPLSHTTPITSTCSMRAPRLAAGRAAKAMEEYGKIIDRGRWLNEGTREYASLYPLAHQGVARAAAGTGDLAKSQPASL